MRVVRWRVGGCVCVQRSTPFEGGAAVCCVVVFVLVVGWGSMLCVV